MSFLTSIKSIFVKAEPVTIVQQGWRTGMWVMDGTSVAIIHKLDQICEVHYVNPDNGETIEIANRPLNALRQCKYLEIPECRRGITQEQAQELGYGS